MKIVADNRKNQDSILTTEPQKEQIELKTKRIPKYIHIGGNKILTPKELVIIKQENRSCEPYIFYADKRCIESKVSNTDLEQARRKKEILILLRTPKKNGVNVFGFTQSREVVMSYRKMRLANAINLSIVGAASGREYQTIEQFIRSEGVYKEGIELEDLKERFLHDLDPILILKDIKRLIHLHYQETISNENTASNKHSKKPK